MSAAVPAVTPGELGTRQRGGRAAGGHQQAVDVAVIVAGKFDDHVPAGESAGQADGAHRGFGAGADQPHFFDRRHRLDDQFGQFAFGLGRRAEARSPGRGRLHRLDHLRMGMAQDHRPPGADVVDVAIAIDVEQIGPFAAGEEDRLAADSAKRPGRAIDAAGYQLLGASKGGMAFVSARHGSQLSAGRMAKGHGLQSGGDRNRKRTRPGTRLYSASQPATSLAQ